MHRRLALKTLCAAALNGGAMSADAAAWRFHRVPLDTGGWSGVRLAADEAPQLLVAVDGADHRRRLWPLSLRGIDDAAARLAPQPVLELPGLLAWDAQHAPAGWRVLSIHPGSGVAPLVLHVAGAQKFIDTADERGIFARPRFAGAGEDVVAIDLAQEYALTLYRRRPQDGAGHAPRQRLSAPRADEVVQAVHLLPWQAGWLLFVQRFEPGPYRPRGPGGETEPQRSGLLDLQLLDAQGRPQGPVTQPFGERPVFEVAVAAAAGRAAVLATTATGHALATGAPDDRGARWTLEADQAWPADLWSPCLQATPQRLRIALLEGSGGPVKPALLLAERPWRP